MAVINPQHARTIIDFTDQNYCLLTVGGNSVDMSTPYYGLDSLEISYDGKTLNFSEIATPNIGNPSFNKNDLVELKLKFSDPATVTGAETLTTYFKGRIVSANHEGANNSAKISYVAHGMQTLANQVPVVSSAGLPHAAFGVGYTFITTMNSVSIYGRSTKDTIDELFDCCATTLGSFGIPADIGTPGSDTLSGYMSKESEFKNATFLDAVKEVLSNDPTKRIFFDDTQQKWIFPDLYTATITTVTVGSVNATNMAYSESIENRYSALTYYTYYTGPYTLPFRGYALCTPLWTSSSTWAVDVGTGISTVDTASVPQCFSVYRQWSIPDITSERNPRFPMRLYAQYGFGRGAKFVPFDAYIDMNAKVVTAKAPVYHKGNPYHPGHAKGPDNVYVTWWKVDAFQTSGYASMRTPAAGFEGTAYDWFGVEKEWKEMVENEKFNTYDLAERFKTLKEVIIEASIPFAGDPIEDFINLQRRVLVRDASVSTRLESITPALTGYSYKFGPVGESVIKLSTSLEGMTKNG